MRANLDESFVVFTFKDSSSLPFFFIFFIYKGQRIPTLHFFFLRSMLSDEKRTKQPQYVYTELRPFMFEPI